MGPFSLYAVETGRFKLDGGAMFGVVPKTLWSREIASDDKNRITMAMRCLLIKSENTGKVYLVDNGCGTKFDEKFEKIYALDHDHSDLLSSLEYHGFEPEDITDLVLSHLHFDHCGGTTYYDDSGNIAHRFPNATYHVPRKHWETANNPNAREKASFFKENIRPMEESGRLNLVEEGYEYEEGFTAIPVNGHTICQQLPMLEAEGKTLVFCGDLIPTHVHVPLPWVMGYDMYPVRTLEEKARFLDEASENEWYLFLEHDAEEEVIQIQKSEGKYGVAATMKLSDV